MNKYPTNFKEAIISAIPNCTTMVLTMMTLNLYIYGHLTLANFVAAFPKIWLTAFCLDFFVVGPMVMRFVSRYNIRKYMPIFRVGLMAGILTFLAPLIETGMMIPGRWYLIAFPRNYIVALGVQVFLALPCGLYVLRRWRQMYAINSAK